MRRDQLAHILRAAPRITKDNDILVIGSQSILGSFDEGELPEPAWVSVEADLAFFDGDQRKPDLVDAMIGEDSQFHQTFGMYGQGVDLTTAVLPAGWRERLVPFRRDDALPSRAQCLEPHDFVISKLVAGREKDYVFAWALMKARLVDAEVLLERAAQLETVPAVRRRVSDWLGAMKGPLTQPGA